MLKLVGIPLLFFNFIFGQIPSSNNYKLQSYGVGSGGTAGSTSNNYGLEAITGELGGLMSGGLYGLRAGFINTQQANVPPAPAWANSSNWYNKLHLTLNNGANPADSKFAVAISTDDFVTTNYVQSDGTVGAVLGPEDYQTYINWGGVSGIDVIGLAASTTYKVKVKAIHGNFTETGYGPTATAATVSPQLSFDIDVASTDTETAPPYNINVGSLLVDTVITSSDKIWFDFATNAANGGNIYVYGLNNGLFSSGRSNTIVSASADLDVAAAGYGAQSSSATQTSGGPLTVVSPYDGSAQNVGLVTTTIRQIYNTAAPVTGGRASFVLKAKSQALTPAATDYSDTLTAIASGNY